MPGLSRFVLSIFLFPLLGLSACGEIAIRLVDHRERVALEYWVKDLELPAESRMAFRAPQHVYLDGLPLAYGSYGGLNAESRLQPETHLDLTEDLQGKAAAEPTVNSDRVREVHTGEGFQAIVRCGETRGEHVLEPGGLRFVVEKAGVTSKSAALVVRDPNTVYLLCSAVDFNLFPGGAAQSGTLEVCSGGKTIFAGPYGGRNPSVVRLYLPISPQAYQMRLAGAPAFSFVVEETRVKIQTPPPVGNTPAASADGFTIAVQPATQEPATPSLAITRPAATRPELCLFTDRRRRVFREGEPVEISLRAYGPGAATATPTWELLDSGQTTVLGKTTLSPADRDGAVEVRLDTRLLRPGDYQLQARWNGALSNLLPLTIAAALPETNLALFTHVKWGPSTTDPKLLERAVRAGLNVVSMGDQGDKFFHGVGETPLEAWHRRPEEKSSASADSLAELMTPPTRHGQAMDYLLAAGIRYLPVAFYGKWMILYFNVGPHWLDQAEDRYQTVQHLAQEFRRYPNFCGIVYTTGDGPTPATMGHVFGTAGVANFDVIHSRRLEKLRELFQAKYGVLPPAGKDSANPPPADQPSADQLTHGLAWGFHVGEAIPGLAAGGDQEKKLLWSQWINDLYPEQFRNCRRALAAMVENPLVLCGSSWGIGAGGGTFPGTFYRSLDYPLNDAHGDFGLCNFNYLTGSDILNMGLTEKGQRTWEALDLVSCRTAESGFKLLLEAFSRNPAGIGVLNLDRSFPCDWSTKKDRTEDLRRITDIARRFGDLLLHLDRADEIAVVSSFRQEALGGQPFRALWAAHYIASKAGYQANVVSDAFCEAQPAELARRFKALWLFGMKAPVSSALQAALVQFQQQGGLLLTDEGSRLELPSVIATGFAVPESHGPSNQVDHLEFERFFAPYVEKFAAAVRPRLKPFFTLEDSRFTGVRSRDGDLEYLTVFNDAKPAIEDGIFSQFLYQGAATQVGLAQAGVLYDALRRQPVDVKQHSGGISFAADMTLLPGSVYLLAPRAIEAIEVAAPRQAATGQIVALRAEALDHDRQPFSGRLPLEFVLTDPSGKLRYRVFRTTRADVFFKIAANDAAGAWQWSAVEQATGLAAHGSFTVTAGTPAVTVQPQADLVYDPAAVRSLLAHREVEIALDHQQLALLPTAQRLLAELRGRGVKASLRTIWPSQTRNYPMQWDYLSIEDREIRDGVLGGQLVGRRVRGKNQDQTDFSDAVKFTTAFYANYTDSAEVVYYKDVILLERGDLPPGTLLRAIHRGQMLRRNVSPNFPAAGQGLVAYAWAPFHYGHDAVIAYGRDRAGLDQAVASLLRLAEPPAGSGPKQPDSAGPGGRIENGQVFSAMGLALAGDSVRVTGTERHEPSLLPPAAPRLVLSATVDAAGRIAVRHRLPTDRDDAAVTSLIDPDKRTATVSARVPAQPKQIETAAGVLAGVDRGVGLFDASRRALWYYEPFPQLGTYQEAKYPRQCQRLAISADGHWLLSAFYDVTPSGGNFTQCVNRPDVVWLNAQTGDVAAVLEGWYGSHLALSSDGSRAVVLDEFSMEPKEHFREFRNPAGKPALGVFDRTGKTLLCLPVQPPIDELLVSADASTAVLRYGDARGFITLVDLTNGRMQDQASQSTDVGATIRADGGLAVICYRDGSACGWSRSTAGKTDAPFVPAWTARTPVPGVPVFAGPDRNVMVAAGDGVFYRLDAEGQLRDRLPFLSTFPAELPPAVAVALPLPPRPQHLPWWQRLPKQWREPLAAPAPLAQKGIEFSGRREVPLSVAKLEAGDVLLLRFQYRLSDPAGVLAVSVPAEGKNISLQFGYQEEAAWASVAIPAMAGTVPVTFDGGKGVKIFQGSLDVLPLHSWSNAALTSMPGRPIPGGNRNQVSVRVPANIGLLGDPRVNPLDLGITPRLSGKLHLAITDPYSYVDGKRYAGTPLYPVLRRSDDLRSAQIVIEFDQPRPIEALGVWEDPDDAPTAEFSLECCDRYQVGDPLTKELLADWKLVCVGRGNRDFFHLHAFPTRTARIWRYTILNTPAVIQRCAEIELWEASVGAGLDSKDPPRPSLLDLDK
jgi:hypothetical protein